MKILNSLDRLKQVSWCSLIKNLNTKWPTFAVLVLHFETFEKIEKPVETKLKKTFIKTNARYSKFNEGIHFLVEFETLIESLLIGFFGFLWRSTLSAFPSGSWDSFKKAFFIIDEERSFFKNAQFKFWNKKEGTSTTYNVHQIVKINEKTSKFVFNRIFEVL